MKGTTNELIGPALAQQPATGEPVGQVSDLFPSVRNKLHAKGFDSDAPLYTHPAPSVPATPEPVLFIHPDTFAMNNAHVGAWKPGHELTGYIPLYTTPQPAQATQAEVTDAEIVAVMRDGNNCNYNDEAEHIQFARAILALRPVQVPMTDEQISLEAHNADDRDWNDLRFRSSWHEGFLEGARFAEAHHSITAQAKKGTNGEIN